MAQKTVEPVTLQKRLGRPKKVPSVADDVTLPDDAREQAISEKVVVFTSYDGLVREVGDLPPNLGRATALANENSVSKIWGTSEEEAACHAMREEI